MPTVNHNVRCFVSIPASFSVTSPLSVIKGFKQPNLTVTKNIHIPFSELSKFRRLQLLGYSQGKIVIINWKWEKGCKEPSECFKVRCFVDPTFYPSLLPIGYCQPHNNVTLLLPFASERQQPLFTQPQQVCIKCWNRQPSCHFSGENSLFQYKRENRNGEKML